ncbi:hypothetical protein [Mucilaginibacter sp. CSA2-8R]|uniref:hypothetical protein n=1 Tax=Mucilaginibacter sp. CSA2-8R TaxID=3141542 RepID=UPI00315CF2B8
MKPKEELRPVERQFENYSKTVSTLPNTALLYAAVILTLFGLMLFAWALPFPHLGFLGKYNGYVNWASFLIAGLIYYYLRLSPTVSYLLLFILFAFSYIIIQLEQRFTGSGLLLTGLGVLLVGLAGQRVIYKKLSNVPVFTMMINAPLWLMVSLLRKLKVRY